MAKRARKKAKRRTVKKTSKNNLYLPIILVFVFVAVFAVILFYFSSPRNEQTPGGDNEIPSTNPPVIPSSIEGYCKSNYECFISYCKGRAEDCINATQMAIYPKNCEKYSDWVVKQDASRCACSDSICTMR